MKSNHGHLDSVAAFRGDLRAPLPLHPLETALLWVVGLNVCSLPWMLGGMRPWAQFISLGLSVCALILALIPRKYDGELVHGEAYRTRPWKRLIHWPIFWIGLLFFIYVLLQALNPAWAFVQLENSWGMREVDHIKWLPTGMNTPFAMMNTWRQMMIWGGPFLTICAIWIGFSRQRSAILLLTAVILNSTVLAVAGFAFRALSNDRILGLVENIGSRPFASFIYKNHAGGYFAVCAGIGIALALWHHERALKYFRKSSPAGVFMLLAMLAMLAVLLSYSRAAILIAGVYLTLIMMLGAWFGIRRGLHMTSRWVSGFFVIGVIAFLAFGFNLLNSNNTLDRIQRLADSDRRDRSMVSRRTAWQAASDMAQENPLKGWGAGSFRYLFPKFQQNYESITWADTKRKKGYLFWEYAHNDLLQSIIEVGRVWALLAFIVALRLVIVFIRRGGVSRLSTVALGMAFLIPIAHGIVDFPLQNPAILSLCATTGGLCFLLLTPRRSPANLQKRPN